MSKKFFFVAVSSLCLGACVSDPPKTAPEEASAYDTGDAYVSLAESANAVSHSLTDLKSTEQAANPPKNIALPPDPASYGMSMLTSIDWNGPVKPVVEQIANSTNYKLKVLGKEPSIPVIVSIRAQNEPVGYILRDIGYQCGSKADVVIFPSRRLIELRYASE
jgi:defect-in-organelle-trafficking protein DotD